MSRLLLVAVSLALVCAAPPAARAQEFKGQTPPDTPVTPVEQELIQLERAWDAAFVAKDMRFIERVLADEFVATYGDGTRGDKAAEMAQTIDRLARRLAGARASFGRITARTLSSGSAATDRPRPAGVAVTRPLRRRARSAAAAGSASSSKARRSRALASPAARAITSAGV